MRSYLASDPDPAAPVKPSTPWLKLWPIKFFDYFKEIELPDSAGRVGKSDAVKGFLHSIQGNILNHHGRDHSALLFFRHGGTAADRRNYIKAAGEWVTSALTQWLQARDKYRAPTEDFIGFALTKDGIQKAGCRMPADKAFAEGMFDRKGKLLDKEWEETTLAGNDLIHGVWILGNAKRDLLEALVQRIADLDAQVKIVAREDGVVLRNRQGDAVEPFGYRDGVSMPEFFEEDGGPNDGLVNLPLDNVLINDNAEEYGGSYLVFRKLRQDVEGFRQFERDLAVLLENANLDPIDAGRFIVGRNRGGVPLAPLNARALTTKRLDLNDFNFTEDPKGSRCPFHAHIRKAHPRSLMGKLDRKHDSDVQTQFVRRGVVFGRAGETVLDPLAPVPSDTGLLFLAYMSDIREQFEFMQSTWMSHHENPGTPPSQPDPLLYGGRENMPEWRWQQFTLKLKELVATAGGAYFFAPPIRWLKTPPTGRR